MTSTDDKVVVGLTHGPDDPEDVLLAYLMGVEALRAGNEALLFLTKDAVQLAFDGGIERVELEGAPTVAALHEEYEERGGRTYACPVCVNLRGLADEPLVGKAEVKGAPSMYEFATGGALVLSC
jgi:predicted peroxiredoxin